MSVADDFRVEPYSEPVEVVGGISVQVLALTFGRARIVTWHSSDKMTLLDGY